jgi:hypothetical protein
MFNRKESPITNSLSSLQQADRLCRSHWPWKRIPASQQRYQVCDRLHQERTVNVCASEIAGTVAVWLADLGVQSPLVEQLALAVQVGDWPKVRGICEHLSVDVSCAV